ncbi:MAG: hypothetical protein AB7O59_25480 [Pirellulales bacterium]
MRDVVCENMSERDAALSELTMRTVSGVYISLHSPDPDVITIFDVAHSLGRICRFNGALWSHYSVAEHAILVSHLVEDPSLRLEALMHDAGEFVNADLPGPVKEYLRLAGCTVYDDLEARIMAAVRARFELRPGPWPAVKRADKLARALEDEALRGLPWPADMARPAWNRPIDCCHAALSRDLFLARFYELEGHKPARERAFYAEFETGRAEK